MALTRAANTLLLWNVSINSDKGGSTVCDEAFGVNLGGTALAADLGGSSKCSNKSFDNRSGEWFHVNNIWTWVSGS